MDNPKLSIIIPVYNVERYIEKNIKSLINQTYSNVELLFVDDGSTDKSGEILDKYKDIDLKIKVIHTDNNGVSHARNCGIENAVGEYISFVDGDDFVDKDYADYLIKLIQYNNSNMAISLYHHTNSFLTQDYNQYIKTLSSKEVIEGIYMNKIYMAVWNKIYKRSFLEKYNIRFNENIWYAEGMHFNIQCLARIQYVNVGNRRIYHYIDNPESAMRKGFNLLNEECALRSIDEQRDILNRNGMYSASLEFHYMMVCFMILCGIHENKDESRYYTQIKNYSKEIRSRWFVPLKVCMRFKQRIKWLLISCAPNYMSNRENRLKSLER